MTTLAGWWTAVSDATRRDLANALHDCQATRHDGQRHERAIRRVGTILSSIGPPPSAPGPDPLATIARCVRLVHDDPSALHTDAAALDALTDAVAAAPRGSGARTTAPPAGARAVAANPRPNSRRQATSAKATKASTGTRRPSGKATGPTGTKRRNTQMRFLWAPTTLAGGLLIGCATIALSVPLTASAETVAGPRASLLVGAGLLLTAAVAISLFAARARDLPTSRIDALAIGTVEVYGTVEAARPLNAPGGGRAVAYQHVVHERHGRTRTKVADDRRFTPFRLRDSSGSVTVDPKHVTMDLVARRGHSRDQSMTDRLLEVGSAAYVRGTATLVDDPTRSDLVITGAAPPRVFVSDRPERVQAIQARAAAVACGLLATTAATFAITYAFTAQTATKQFFAEVDGSWHQLWWRIAILAGVLYLVVTGTLVAQRVARLRRLDTDRALAERTFRAELDAYGDEAAALRDAIAGVPAATARPPATVDGMRPELAQLALQLSLRASDPDRPAHEAALARLRSRADRVLVAARSHDAHVTSMVTLRRHPFVAIAGLGRRMTTTTLAAPPPAARQPRRMIVVISAAALLAPIVAVAVAVLSSADPGSVRALPVVISDGSDPTADTFDPFATTSTTQFFDPGIVSNTTVPPVPPTETPTTAPTEAPTTRPTVPPTTLPTVPPTVPPTAAPTTVPPGPVLARLAGYWTAMCTLDTLTRNWDSIGDVMSSEVIVRSYTKWSTFADVRRVGAALADALIPYEAALQHPSIPHTVAARAALRRAIDAAGAVCVAHGQPFAAPHL